jgi:hypothetical protein
MFRSKTGMTLSDQAPRRPELNGRRRRRILEHAGRPTKFENPRVKALVTGIARFSGSHLAEKLLAEGHDAVGVDSFHDNCPRHVKARSLATLARNSKLTFVGADLLRFG